MSEHTWTQEQIAAYLAGGLALDDAERLETHARDCKDCAAILTSATHLDRGLNALFASIRPQPGLEDRAIRAVRTARQPQTILLVGWPRRIVAAAAAIIARTTFGALAASMMGDGRLPLPGQERLSARLQSDAAPMAPAGGVPIPTSEGEGTLHERFARPAADTPNLDQLAKDLTNEIATSDDKLKSPVLRKVPDPAKVFDRTSETTEARDKFYEAARGHGVKMGEPKYTGAPPFNSNGTFPGGGFQGGFGGGGFGGLPGPGMGLPPGGGSGYGPPGTSAPVPVGPVVPTGVPGPGQPGVTPSAPTYFVPADAKPSNGDKSGEKGTGGDKGGGKPEASKDTPKEGLPAPQPKTTSEPKSVGPSTAVDPEPVRRIVIRSGDIEFEIESFDSALATVTKLVTGIKGAFVGTVNSDKLPNGKVKGSIVVRTPPEFLDSLVLDLRKELGKGGELKSIKLASADITKQYTDIESRLKAARAMEIRLLKMIQDGKGEIKQLLEAERELGIWRTKIEESEGELRYYSNLAALSTLTISLTEKEIRAAVGVTENERVQAGVEVEDVDKAYQAVLKEIVDAKGRVTKSELKQLSAGQFNATLNFEVAPEAGGPIRDRLRQLGRVARLEIDRVQQSDGGTIPKDAKVKRGDTVFLVQLYNLANIAPRETATLSVAAPDVSTTYNALRDAIAKASGRVQVAQLNEQDKQNVTAQLDFDVKRTDEGAIRAALLAAGESTSRQVTRAPESDTVTDTKILYKVTLFAASRLKARETATLSVAVPDVAAAYNAVRDAVSKAAGRVQVSQLNEQDKQNVTAQLDFDVKQTEDGAIRAALLKAGESTSSQVTRAAESETVTDTKVQYKVTFFAVARIKPRDTATLQVAVPDVATSYQTIRDAVLAAKGRVLASQLDENDKQNVTATLDFEVRRTEEPGVKATLENAGEVVSRQIGHAAENEATTDTKVLYRITLLPANRLKPRETTTLGLEVADVEQTTAAFASYVSEVKGRQVDAKSGRERNGKASARMVYEVPLVAAAGIVEKFKSAGSVRVLSSARDQNAPEGKSATARIEVTLANAEGIVNADDGLWPPVKKGLSYSASVLFTSMTWVVFGLCVVLPWAVVGYGGYRLVRRIARPSPTEPSFAAAPTSAVQAEPHGDAGT